MNGYVRSRGIAVFADGTVALELVCRGVALGEAGRSSGPFDQPRHERLAAISATHANITRGGMVGTGLGTAIGTEASGRLQ